MYAVTHCTHIHVLTILTASEFSEYVCSEYSEYACSEYSEYASSLVSMTMIESRFI